MVGSGGRGATPVAGRVACQNLSGYPLVIPAESALSGRTALSFTPALSALGARLASWTVAREDATGQALTLGHPDLTYTSWVRHGHNMWVAV